MKSKNRIRPPIIPLIICVVIASVFFLWKTDSLQKSKSTTWKGGIEKYQSDSTPDWENISPPAPLLTGHPNVLIISLEDIGIGDIGTFGGIFTTPNIDLLAREGVRFTNFHTTTHPASAQAALLTGRNPHSIGFSAFSKAPTGFPNTSGILPNEVKTLSEIYAAAGYKTAMFGQWDLSSIFERSPTGPFKSWPIAKGFNRFFGFFERPLKNQPIALYKDNHLYRLVTNTMNETTNTLAISELGTFLADFQYSANSRPFFAYLALQTTYTEFARPEFNLKKYDKSFIAGPRENAQEILLKQKVLKIIPETAALPPFEDQDLHNQMNAYHNPTYADERVEAAAKFELVDIRLGELFKRLEELGLRENTIIAVVSTSSFPRDSLSSEVARSPFLGIGMEISPLIISWPAGISDRGGIRNQYHHIIDLAPTLLELSTLSQNDSAKSHGVSMVYSFSRPDAESRRKRQYFESLGDRAIYSQGWLARTKNRVENWQLYYLPEDSTALNDLAQIYPERLRELQIIWEQEANKYQVYPLDERPFEERLLNTPPLGEAARDLFALSPGKNPASSPPLPTLYKSEYILTLIFTSKPKQESGVLINFGDLEYGWSTQFNRGELTLIHNIHSHSQERTLHRGRLIGKHELKIHHIPNFSSENATRNSSDTFVYLDQKQVGRIKGMGPGSFKKMRQKFITIGRVLGPTISDLYHGQPEFDGEIHSSTLQIIRRNQGVDFSE